MNSPWTLAYMEVLSRTEKFAAAYLEWRGNPTFTLEVARQRRELEMVLAIYRAQRSRVY